MRNNQSMTSFFSFYQKVLKMFATNKVSKTKSHPVIDVTINRVNLQYQKSLLS